MSYFDILSIELLVIIFNYCDYKDLIQLNLVYNQFYDIISELLEKKSNYLLITSQKSEEFRKRCQPILSSHKLKLSIYDNWKNGIYATKSFDDTFLSGECIFYTNVQLTRDTIWYSTLSLHKQGAFLSAYDRTIKQNGLNCIVNNAILDIVPCNDGILINHDDNSITKWTIERLKYHGKQYFEQKLLLPASSYNEIYFMDATSQNILTSSYNGEIKIWGYVQNENTQKHVIEEKNYLSIYENNHSDSYMKLGYRPIAFDPTGTKFSVCYHSRDYASYFIHDLNKCCTEKYKKIDDNSTYGADLTQLLWKDSNNILLMRGNNIVKLDARTHEVVHTWTASCLISEDIIKKTRIYDDLTCMSSDNSYAIMTGTSNGQIILWDERQDNFIQTYEIPKEEEKSSFINSLEFDSSHIYATAYKVFEFDFTRNIVL